MTDTDMLNTINHKVDLIGEQLKWCIEQIQGVTAMATAMQGGIAGRMMGARNGKA